MGNLFNKIYSEASNRCCKYVHAVQHVRRFLPDSENIKVMRSAVAIVDYGDIALDRIEEIGEKYSVRRSPVVAMVRKQQEKLGSCVCGGKHCVRFPRARVLIAKVVKSGAKNA